MNASKARRQKVGRTERIGYRVDARFVGSAEWSKCIDETDPDAARKMLDIFSEPGINVDEVRLVKVTTIEEIVSITVSAS